MVAIHITQPRSYATTAQTRANSPKSSAPDLFVISHNVYPPSEFAVSMPFAALPIDVAIVLWNALIAACEPRS